nr:AraC family transcriptional regulator [Methylonatrum kenyense]
MEHLDNHETIANVNLQHHPAFNDERIETLLRSIAAEISTGCLSGHLYGQSLSTALICLLIHRYRRENRRPIPSRNELCQQALKEILDYIERNLGGDLSLKRIAALKNMSAQRFCLMFHESVGTTPHQYVIQRRIEKAKRLLTLRSSCIVEIALDLGFSSQSHFTSVFKRMTGVTPKKYRASGTN